MSHSRHGVFTGRQCERFDCAAPATTMQTTPIMYIGGAGNVARFKPGDMHYWCDKHAPQEPVLDRAEPIPCPHCGQGLRVELVGVR